MRIIKMTVIFIPAIFLSIATDSNAEQACFRQNFKIAIDAGHTIKHPGATSATGIGEHSFNKKIAALLLGELKKAGFENAFLINEADREVTLKQRAVEANSVKSDLFISIHHDSVQPVYLSQWEYDGKKLHYSDKYKGFSIFYSKKNKYHEASLLFAKALGSELLERGFSPSLHHAENIPGENRDLIDEKRGIYRFDDLVVLRTTEMPAVLVECGIIVNRYEENLLQDSEYQMKIVGAIVKAIENVCGSAH
ncbi:MAG: N-acetylmuramoyl-L-alanine amidase [Nitrospirae bacterium]|nr:N-acetylmuramoyl-L-alanine amidase [Nitrospirota bacterium]